MKVLIIGGAGMGGRNLAEALVASGRLGDGAVSETGAVLKGKPGHNRFRLL